MELDKFILDDDSYIELVDRKARNNMHSITQELTKLTDEYKRLQNLNISSFAEEAVKINQDLTFIKTTMATKDYTANTINSLKEELYGPGSTEALDTIKELASAIEGNSDILQILNASIGNKLDKITTSYGASVHRIYAIGTQGQQYVITTTDSNNVVATKNYTDNTFIHKQEPEFDSGATRGYVYFIDPNQNQIVKKVQIQANSDTIPLRNPSGNFYVGTPTLPYECVNLGTVTATQGTAAPTEDTKALYVGELYYDKTNNKMYMCFGIDTTNKKYTWAQIIRATDIAGNSIKGVVDVRATFGMQVDQYGRIQTVKATNDEITAKTNEYHPIVPKNLDFAIVQALTNNSITLTDEQKTAIKTWLGI